LALQPSLGGGVSGTGHIRLKPPNGTIEKDWPPSQRYMGWANWPIGGNLESQGENTCNEAEKYLSGEKRGWGCFANGLYGGTTDGKAFLKYFS
jgi:hypothetical protein